MWTCIQKMDTNKLPVLGSSRVNNCPWHILDRVPWFGLKAWFHAVLTRRWITQYIQWLVPTHRIHVMQVGKMTKDRMHTYRWVNASMHACTVTLYALCMWKQKTHTVHIALYVYIYIYNIYIIRGIYHIQNMILTIFCQDSTLPFYTRFSLQLWSKLVEKPLLPKRFASESQRFHVRIIQRLTCESSHKDRRCWPSTTWQQQQPTTKSIAATKATTYRRKFRSLTSDNMDSWKSSAARKKINRCGKKEDQQARNVRKIAKCCVFQCFVCRLGRKVTSLKRPVRR